MQSPSRTALTAAAVGALALGLLGPIGPATALPNAAPPAVAPVGVAPAAPAAAPALAPTAGATRGFTLYARPRAARVDQPIAIRGRAPVGTPTGTEVCLYRVERTVAGARLLKKLPICTVTSSTRRYAMTAILGLVGQRAYAAGIRREESPRFLRSPYVRITVTV